MKKSLHYKYFMQMIAGLAFLLSPFCGKAQVDGEFRSAASGGWATLTTWEKYTAATATWATPTAVPSGTTAIITVRTGNTVSIATNYSFKKLTVQSGGSVISADASEHRLDLAGDTSNVINNGNIGGITGTNDSKLNIANSPTCTIGTISGTGTTSISRIRFNTSTASVTNVSTLIIDQDLTVLSSGITAYYNNATPANLAGENCVITINAGRTVTASGALHTSAAPTGTGGNYTYNINGTLDMSGTATTTLLNPIPNSASVVTINVSGVWKVAKLDATYTGTNTGSIVLNILNGGLVDATKATLFTLGSKYFIIGGTGKLKRAVPVVAGTVTFPIGTSATSYNPVTLAASTVDDSFSVNVSNTLAGPIGDPTKIITKQWNLTPSGLGTGFTPTFGWVSADQGSSFNAANPVSIFTYGTSWNPVSVATAITGSGTLAAPFVSGPSVNPATLSGNYIVGNTSASVSPTIAITANPGNTVCAGVSVTFTATTTNTTTPHYQWKVNGVNVGTDQGTYTSTALNNNDVVTCVLSATVSGPALATSTAITMTINPLAVPGTLSGASSVCVGTTEQLSSTATGGVWSSSNTAFATISTTGLVSGVAVGNVIISYAKTNSCGTVTVTKNMAVTLGASAGTLSGATSVCQNATTPVTSSASGGTWFTSNATAATISTTGVVTGVASGTAIISYVVTNGCGTDTARKTITVNPLPAAGTITGPTVACVGSTIQLANTVTGGAWTSNNSNVVVSSTGLVTGVNFGTTSTISYTTTNTCGSSSTTYVVTVYKVPVVSAITGASSVCVGSSITLADTMAGGAWTSGSSSILTVNNAGLVTGVAVGSGVISYSVTNTCGTGSATKTISVSSGPVASTVSGPDSVCLGSTITLFAGTANGFWSSANGSTIITTDGIVTGFKAGVDTAIYSVSNQCGITNTIHPLKIFVCNPNAVRGIAKDEMTATAFPNPNGGSFTYKVTTAQTQPVKIVVTNILGAVVKTIDAHTNMPVAISLQEAAGIYVLSAITENGKTVTKINITQ